jgi:hypothetical protein
MPETPDKNCPYVKHCPVYKLWRLFGGKTVSLWDVVKQLDQERAAALSEASGMVRAPTIDDRRPDERERRPARLQTQGGIVLTLEGPQPA